MGGRRSGDLTSELVIRETGTDLRGEGPGRRMGSVHRSCLPAAPAPRPELYSDGQGKVKEELP